MVPVPMGRDPTGPNPLARDPVGRDLMGRDPMGRGPMVFSFRDGGVRGSPSLPLPPSLPPSPPLRSDVVFFPNAGSPVVGVVTRVARVAFPLGFRGARRREEAEEEEGEEEGGKPETRGGPPRLSWSVGKPETRQPQNPSKNYGTCMIPAFLGPLGGPLGGSFGHLGALLGWLGAILSVWGRSFSDSGPSWTVLGVS